MDHRAWKSSVPEQFDYKADTPDVELPQPELAEAESILNAMARIFSSSLPVYGHPTTLSGAETRFRSAPATTGADGIMTVDDNGTIESFNEAAEKIFSYARSEVIGRHVSTVLDAPSSPLTSAMSRRGRARARFHNSRGSRRQAPRRFKLFR
jgi:PAS domain-containing protein